MNDCLVMVNILNKMFTLNKIMPAVACGWAQTESFRSVHSKKICIVCQYYNNQYSLSLCHNFIAC